MSHEEFVSAFRANKLIVGVDQSMALRIMSSPFTAQRYRAAHQFWTWVWLLSFPAAIAAFIWVKWWVGLIILLITFAMPKAIKKSASDSVVEQALEDSMFYIKCLEAGVFHISLKSEL